MDERNVSRLLHESAAQPDRPADLAAIDAGIGRRRRTRRAITGAAAASLVLVAAVAGVMLAGDDGSDGVDVVTPPPDTSVPDTSQPDADDVVQPTVLDDVELGQLDGRYLVYGADGISWLVDGHLEQVWTEPVSTAYTDGGGGVVFQDAVREDFWVADDRGAIRWLRPDDTEGQVVVPDGELATLHGVFAVDGEASIVLTRRDPRFPDDGGQYLAAISLESAEESDLGGVGGGDTPMRSAAAGREGVLIQVCHLDCAIFDRLALQAYFDRPGDHQDAALVGWGSDKEYTSGLATAGESVAFLQYRGVIDGETPDGPRLVLVDQGGTTLQSIALSDVDPADVASGVDLDLTLDGSTALIRSLWSEEPRSPLLVRGVGTDSPTVQRVQTDQALRFAPDVPTPGEGPAPVEVDAEDVALADLDGRFLVFGDDGIAWLEDGELDRIWGEPVDEAYPDGMGGVVFQEAGDTPWEPDGTTGAIRWSPVGASSPRTVIAAGERATLRQVGPLNGEATVLFTRWTGPRTIDDGREHLMALPLAGGTEEVLATTGHWGDTGLDAVALTDVGLVASTCHLQCIFRRVGSGELDSVAQWSDWSSGLAGSGEVLAFVGHLSPLGVDGYPEDPVLRLIEARSQPSEIERASDPLVEVRLPHTPGESSWAWVDLSSDGTSALVAYPPPSANEPSAFDVVLVSGLDTAEPRVQVVDTDQALRFG